MKSYRTGQFRKLYKRLPRSVQEQAKAAYELFKTNPYHPSLHFKSIHPELPIYSVRISRSYRAVGVKQGDTIVWYWIGSHADL